MTETDQEQWSKICADTATKMIEQIQPYTSPISRVLSNEEGEHLGSGTYFEVNQKKYIITNEHVAKHLSNNSLTHQFFEDDSIIRLTNPAFAELAPVDVAISRIEENSWNICKHSALAIPIERFASKHNPVQHELLFFAGYSGERSKFLFSHLINRGTPYLVACDFLFYVMKLSL